MTAWQKWLIGAPITIGLNLGLSALAAGEVWWFTHCWSDTAFMLIITVMWVVALALYPAGHGLRWRGTLTRRVIGTGLLLAIGLGVYERTHGPAADRSALWSIAGLALFLTACVVGGLAARTLGRSYSPDLDITGSRQLVTGGIYRLVQHPMYLALLLVSLGMPLMVRSVWGAAAGIILIIPALWRRIGEEEDRLLQAFGDEYHEYQRRTRRLIPFIF
ncbi:MAG: hypothetical protein Kow00124_26760 [Anaerolineae bacterium]